MTEPLTDAELDVLSGDIHRPSSHQVFCKGCGAEWPCLESSAVAELRELREQKAALDAQLRTLRADVARAQWRAAMAQIDVGQKVLEQLAAADALADAVEMAETSVKWFAWPDLAAALLAYRERRARNAV